MTDTEERELGDLLKEWKIRSLDAMTDPSEEECVRIERFASRVIDALVLRNQELETTQKADIEYINGVDVRLAEAMADLSHAEAAIGSAISCTGSSSAILEHLQNYEPKRGTHA